MSNDGDRPVQEETDDEYAQRVMDWYGVDTIEEAIAIEEAESAAEEGIEIDRVAAEIESGVRPNKKDIVYLLRNYRRADIPQVLREYIAKLLEGNLGGSQRNSRLNPHGGRLMKFAGFEKEIEDMFGPVEDIVGICTTYDMLQSAGFYKKEAFWLIAEARLMGIMEELIAALNGPEPVSQEQISLLIEEPWEKYEDNAGAELKPILKREFSRLSHIKHPRKNRKK